MGRLEFGGSGGGKLFPEAGSFLSGNEGAGRAPSRPFAVAGVGSCSPEVTRHISESPDVLVKIPGVFGDASIPGFPLGLVGGCVGDAGLGAMEPQAGAQL